MRKSTLIKTLIVVIAIIVGTGTALHSKAHASTAARCVPHAHLVSAPLHTWTLKVDHSCFGQPVRIHVHCMTGLTSEAWRNGKLVYGLRKSSAYCKLVAGGQSVVYQRRTHGTYYTMYFGDAPATLTAFMQSAGGVVKEQHKWRICGGEDLHQCLSSIKDPGVNVVWCHNIGTNPLCRHTTVWLAVHQFDVSMESTRAIHKEVDRRIFDGFPVWKLWTMRLNKRGIYKPTVNCLQLGPRIDDHGHAHQIHVGRNCLLHGNPVPGGSNNSRLWIETPLTAYYVADKFAFANCAALNQDPQNAVASYMWSHFDATLSRDIIMWRAAIEPTQQEMFRYAWNITRVAS